MAVTAEVMATEVMVAIITVTEVMEAARVTGEFAPEVMVDVTRVVT